MKQKPTPPCKPGDIVRARYMVNGQERSALKFRAVKVERVDEKGGWSILTAPPTSKDDTWTRWLWFSDAGLAGTAPSGNVKLEVVK